MMESVYITLHQVYSRQRVANFVRIGLVL